MSAHNVQNSQCDLNMYGPDPGDGSVKCTCDEDAPIEPSTAPRTGPAPAPRSFPHLVSETTITGGPDHVTLTGRAAATHTAMIAAGRRFAAAQREFNAAKEDYQRSLDAHMEAALPPEAR
jgi:hypothetical protein